MYNVYNSSVYSVCHISIAGNSDLLIHEKSLTNVEVLQEERKIAKGKENGVKNTELRVRFAQWKSKCSCFSVKQLR